MKHSTILLGAVAFTLSALCACPLGAQDKPKAQEPKGQSASTQDMMKVMMELGAPAEQHRKLAELAGSWDVTTALWMEPGKPPSVTKGTSTYTMVLGGRFLMEETKGEMMGMPMSGIGLTGFDKFDKKYVMMWIDDTGTAMFTAEGNADPSGDVIACYGKMGEPTTGEHGKNVKYVLRLIDKNKHIMEIHDLSIAEPNTKVVEVTYTRKK